MDGVIDLQNNVIKPLEQCSVRLQSSGAEQRNSAPVEKGVASFTPRGVSESESGRLAPYVTPGRNYGGSL